MKRLVTGLVAVATTLSFTSSIALASTGSQGTASSLSQLKSRIVHNTPSYPMTIEVQGKVIMKTTSKYYNDHQEQIDNRANKILKAKENANTSNQGVNSKSTTITPSLTGTYVPLTYNSSSDMYEASGSNLKMKFDIQYFPTYLNSGDTLYDADYLTNNTGSPQALYYYVGWDPSQLRNQGSPSALSGDVYPSSANLNFVSSSLTTTKIVYDSLNPGQQGGADFQFTKENNSVYYWRSLSGGYQFKTGNCYPGDNVWYAQFSTTDTAIIN